MLLVGCSDQLEISPNIFLSSQEYREIGFLCRVQTHVQQGAFEIGEQGFASIGEFQADISIFHALAYVDPRRHIRRYRIGREQNPDCILAMPESTMGYVPQASIYCREERLVFPKNRTRSLKI